MIRGSTDPRAVLHRALQLPTVADAMAEALMSHDDCCGMHQAALLILELGKLSEVQFLLNWAAGLYDA